MPEELDRLQIVGFAAPPELGGSVSPEFPILRADTYTKSGRKMEVTEADLDRAVANFQRWQEEGQEIPVDYDHGFAEAGDSRAAGWFASLRREADKLMAKIRWNAKARADLEAGEYRYFSPEFHEDWANERGEKEGFTILAGALTNRPFLRGMTRVAFSQERPPLEAFAESFGDLQRAAAGDSPTRDETQREVPDEKLTVEIDGKPEEFSAERVAELVKERDEKPESFAVEIDGEEQTFSADEIRDLKAKAGRAEGAQSENEQLSQRLGKVEKDLTAERFSAAFSKAQREGRVDAVPETREKWNQRVEKFGLDEAIELLHDIPAETVVPTGPAVGGGGEPGSTEAAPAPPERVEADATDAVGYAIDTKARELMSQDSDLSYEDASLQAEQLVGTGR